MAKMKIGTKSKKNQPKKSYAISVSMAPQEEQAPQAPEVVEVEKVVERIVEKVVEVEVPVRLGEPMSEKKCEMCKDAASKVKELEGVMAASADEVQDLVEGMAETIKAQDRRIKEIELEIDREMAAQLNDLETRVIETEARNVKAVTNIKRLEKICAGIIVVTGITILTIMSIN